jgi:hypothetical protein
LDERLKKSLSAHATRESRKKKIHFQLTTCAQLLKVYSFA